MIKNNHFLRTAFESMFINLMLLLILFSLSGFFLIFQFHFLFQQPISLRLFSFLPIISRFLYLHNLPQKHKVALTLNKCPQKNKERTEGVEGGVTREGKTTKTQEIGWRKKKMAPKPSPTPSTSSVHSHYTNQDGCKCKTRVYNTATLSGTDRAT